jgi:hypothetical protein
MVRGKRYGCLAAFVTLYRSATHRTSTTPSGTVLQRTRFPVELGEIWGDDES